jgi:hypothetical protein
MTDSDRSTFQQLCDLADLDVLGLLDEVDQPEFEQGFNRSTPLEQDQIRERQAQMVTRLVGELELDATEGPSEELRQRVIESILSENDRLEASLAPLARIGRRRRERIQRSGVNRQDLELSVADRTIQLRQAARSATVWRAASFALMAGLLASLIAGVIISRDAQEANRLASQQSATEQLKDRYSVDLESMLLANEDQHVLGLSTEVATNGGLTVRLDKVNNTVDLVVFGLKPGEYFVDYTIDGKRNQIPFRLDHRATVVSLSNIPDGLASTLASSSWTITDQDGNTVARCNSMIAV